MWEEEGVMTLTMRLARAQFQYWREKLEKLDLYPGQPQLLLALKHHEHASQKELAKAMEITSATLTVMLRRMESKQLVSRESDPQDLRIMRLCLTEKGREKVDAIERLIAQSNDMFSELFSKEEIETVCLMMHKVCTHLEALMQEEK